MIFRQTSHIKYVQINVEDGTGLVRVILWREEKECMAQCCLIHECNSNFYICVIREVEDYYGVHRIIRAPLEQELIPEY